MVGVDEWIAEGLGENPPDGGLSGSHKSDKDDVRLHVLAKTLPF